MTSEIKYTQRAKRRSRDWASRWWLRWASTLRPWLRLLLNELLKETLHAWMVQGSEIVQLWRGASERLEDCAAGSQAKAPLLSPAGTSPKPESAPSQRSAASRMTSLTMLPYV